MEAAAFVWDIDRVIFKIGFFELRYYSLLFASTMIFGFFILKSIFLNENKPEKYLDSLLIHVVLGTVIGARLGHCLLYEPMEYLNDPIRILKVWEGGLASHGGFTGVIIALILFCKKHRDIGFFWLADRVAIPAMLGAGLIRIGNFFNSEIIGRETDVPWAVIFAKIDNVPRHPSQIYEALGYIGVSAILYGVYRFANRRPLEGRLFGLVLVLAYAYRTFAEQFKENQVAFEEGMALNMGQLLSLPFIAIGVLFALGLHHKLGWLQVGVSPSQKQTVVNEAASTVEKTPSKKGERRKQRKKLKTR